MQLLAKFKKILYMELRATLNFQKFKIPKREWYTIENLINIFFIKQRAFYRLNE